MHSPPRLAIYCRHLRRTIDFRRPDSHVATLCTHIVREGSDCVGPFLEGYETECRLWEPAPEPPAYRRRS